MINSVAISPPPADTAPVQQPVAEGRGTRPSAVSASDQEAFRRALKSGSRLDDSSHPGQAAGATTSSGSLNVEPVGLGTEAGPGHAELARPEVASPQLPGQRGDAEIQSGCVFVLPGQGAAPAGSLAEMSLAARARWDTLAQAEADSRQDLSPDAKGAGLPDDLDTLQVTGLSAPELADLVRQTKRAPLTPELDDPRRDPEEGEPTTVSSDALLATLAAQAAQAATAVNATSAVLAPRVEVSTVVAKVNGLEVADVVREVTRTLAWRDLDALQAGREVVVQLDDRVLPQTSLTFRAEGAQVAVNLQTLSPDVQAYLDVNRDRLMAAMAAEAPTVQWVWDARAPALQADAAGLEGGFMSDGRGQGTDDPTGGSPGQRSSQDTQEDRSSDRGEVGDAQGRPSLDGVLSARDTAARALQQALDGAA